MNLAQAFDRFLNRRPMPTFYAAVPAEHVLDSDFEAITLAPEEAYLQIRLAEMRLRNSREHGREFAPFAVVVSQLLYDGESRTIPILVGKHLLGQTKPEVDGEWISFLDARVAGPLLYRGDELSIFVGLYRAEVASLAKSMFDLLDSVVDTFDLGQISKHLKPAARIGAGLLDLLGVQEVEPRLGVRTSLGDGMAPSRQLSSGYLAYVRGPEDRLCPEQLWVRRGRLHVGENASAPPCREWDFCLISIEHLRHRNDYTRLAAHSRWREAQRLVWQGQPQIATMVVQTILAQDLLDCRDLTRTDRFRLLEVYKANLEAEIDAYKHHHGLSGARGAVLRGGGTLDAKSMIQRAAWIARDAGLAQPATSLLELSRNWRSIPGLDGRAHGFELSDSLLGQQLDHLDKGDATDTLEPEQLAHALALDLLEPQASNG